MYSREKRQKAVELYIKFGKSAAAFIRELGYPDRKTLRMWYRKHIEEHKTGVLHRNIRTPKFTEEQKQEAVRHYLENGLSYSGTSRALG